MILQTKPLPELHSHQPGSAGSGKYFLILGTGWKSNGAKSGLQGRWWGISQRKVFKRFTHSCHGFCLNTDYQWLPTNLCIWHRKNKLQFTLLPLSTLSVWSPSFNLCWTWVCGMRQCTWWTPCSTRNIILTYTTVTLLTGSPAWQQNREPFSLTYLLIYRVIEKDGRDLKPL
jgi:hypothetical protein